MVTVEEMIWDGIKWAQVVLRYILAPSLTSASDSSKLLIFTTVFFVYFLFFFFVVLWGWCFFFFLFQVPGRKRKWGWQTEEFPYASWEDGVRLCLLVYEAKVLTLSKSALSARAFLSDGKVWYPPHSVCPPASRVLRCGQSSDTLNFLFCSNVSNLNLALYG